MLSLESAKKVGNLKKIKHDKGDYFTLSFDDIIMYQEKKSLETI